MLHKEALFIVQAVLLIGLPYLLWRFQVVRRLTPLVVIQILIGILLGPSVLGKIAPEFQEYAFSKESLVAVNGLSWLALLCFGFLTGTHLDLEEIQGKGKAFLIVSLGSILVPVVLGGGSGMGTTPSLPTPGW